MNRIPKVSPRADGQPEYNMKVLLQELGPPLIVPDVDKYYVFIYKAKTPNTLYDQHPFIVCTGLYPWGFSGYNFHWEDYRRYSWREVISNIYEIHEDELNDMQNFPIKRLKST